MYTSSRVSASSCGSQAIRTRYRQDHYNQMHIVGPVLMLYESSTMDIIRMILNDCT